VKIEVGKIRVAKSNHAIWFGWPRCLYFLIAKLIGTIIAATVILLIHWSNRRLALVVAGAVACSQILLLIYLSTE
jgi:hypothetical protein